MESLCMRICSWYIVDAVLQDERYAKYIGKQAIVPLTFGRHVPIISDKVGKVSVSVVRLCKMTFLRAESIWSDI